MTNLRNRMSGVTRRRDNARVWRSKAAERQARQARAQQERKEALQRAETARLLVLLDARRPATAMAEIREELANLSPETAYVVLLLTATLGAALRRSCKDGLTWEQFHEGLLNKQSNSPLVRTAMKRSGRAMRLIKRLVRRGCYQRGEA